MTSKQLKSVGSDDIDDYSSVYTDDFETDSPLPSPDNKYERTSGYDKTTESDGSSFSGGQKHNSNNFKAQKVYGTKQKAGKTSRKSSGLPKTRKKNLSPAKTDIVQSRMLSAQRSRINALNNELGELHNKLEEVIKENKLLKKLQFRQEKSLRKFENKDSDIPRLISQYEEDHRILKAKLRKTQDSERALESKVRESNEEIQKMEHSVQKLKKLVDDKNLGERSELTKQLNDSQDRLFDCEKKKSELGKKLELTTQSFSRQLNGEKAKHSETKEKLKTLQEKLEDMENRLKEKDRALQVSNIYSLRARHNLEKAAVNLKTRHSRKSPKKSDQDKSKPFQESLSLRSFQEFAPGNEKPLSAGSTMSVEDISSHSNFTDDSISLSKSLSSRNDSAKSVGELTGDLDALGLHSKSAITSEKEHEKDQLSFLKSEKSGNSSIVHGNVTPTSPNTVDSGVIHSPMLREKSFTVASKSNKVKEDEEKKVEEERKKAALLARMKDLNENSSVLSDARTCSDLGKFLDGPPTQKPVLHHKKTEVSSMERHLNDDRNGLEHGDESELAFGGYAPTVTSAPKRRLQSRAPPVVDSDKPLFDLNNAKSRNSDLLQQLFGSDVSRPSTNERTKNNFYTSAKTAPKEAIGVTSHLDGSGDIAKQRKDDIIGYSQVSTMPHDDDIEEMSL